jgi:hypothetical protein
LILIAAFAGGLLVIELRSPRQAKAASARAAPAVVEAATGSDPEGKGVKPPVAVRPGPATRV